MNYTIRPLGPWLEPVTENRRGSHLFRASWQDTLDLLGRETELLGADQVVLQIDVTDGELRRDGMLRANARVEFPGVRVSLDSKHGPLTYATDAYERAHYDSLPGWQANIRAIALALEALRAVDRYGVTRSGEQYRGWAQLTATPAEMTVAEAAEFLAHWARDPRYTAEHLLRNPGLAARAWQVAARRAHPDAGGDNDTFDRLTKARGVINREAHRG